MAPLVEKAATLALDQDRTQEIGVAAFAAPDRAAPEAKRAEPPAQGVEAQDAAQGSNVGSSLSLAATRPGTAVVPWKPSVPAPSDQPAGSVIVQASAKELSLARAPKQTAARVLLEVVEGRDAGRRVPMRGTRMSVGRDAGCDLQLADVAVSRHHLELVDGPAGLELRDVSDGAGTQVNGKPVARTLLRPGDRITLGATVLAVRRGRGAVRSLARRALEATKPILSSLSPRRRSTAELSPREQWLSLLPAGRLGRLAVASVGLSLLGLLVLLMLPARKDAPQAAPRVGDQVIALTDGQRLLDAQQFDAALRRAREAQRINDTPEARRFVERCREALLVKNRIESAQAAAARGHYDLALAKGKAIRADGLQGARLEGLLKTWSEARDNVIVSSVRAVAGDGDYEAARALAVRGPVARQTSLLREVDELESQALAGQGTRPP